ncbi:hypothetical protein CHS0354_026189 [Potamilus streckersoni]|uniref:Uncharacterized protein n=1 Tax=Potamilus streckersoni TaxID=2493646 RepID=A0AAE0SUL4_9BIVA|nr:hypothetical protein CHS0354_026189 [Potamilus streckersoni]
MKELEDFLKKRGLQQDLIKKNKELKIDCQTKCVIPDSQLQLYISKLGDIYATKRLCQELFKQTTKV